MMLWLVGWALAGTHEIYGGMRFDGHQSLTHVGLGVGGQVGYRYRAGKLTVGGAQFFGDWGGLAAVTELEVGLSPLAREQATRFALRPWVGLEGAIWWTPYTVARADALDPSGPVVSPRVAVRPLVLSTRSGWTLSALELSVGVGLEAPGRSVSGGLGLFVLGYRWE